jgi:hypothetical protein
LGLPRNTVIEEALKFRENSTAAFEMIAAQDFYKYLEESEKMKRNRIASPNCFWGNGADSFNLTLLWFAASTTISSFYPSFQQKRTSTSSRRG